MRQLISSLPVTPSITSYNQAVVTGEIFTLFMFSVVTDI